MDNSNDRFYFRAEGAWRFLAFYYCLLFDVDGTLLDFNAAEDGALRDTLAHFSLPNTEDAVSQYHDINNALWAALEQGIDIDTLVALPARERIGRLKYAAEDEAADEFARAMAQLEEEIAGAASEEEPN